MKSMLVHMMNRDRHMVVGLLGRIALSAKDRVPQMPHVFGGCRPCQTQQPPGEGSCAAEIGRGIFTLNVC